MPAMHELVDSFGSLDPARWEYTAGRAAISMGRLQLVPGFVDPLDVAAPRMGGEAWSVASYDLQDSWLQLETFPSGAASGISEWGAFVTSPRTTGLGWRVAFDPGSSWGWSLQARRLTAGAVVASQTLVLDPEEYRWTRILEDGSGTVLWQTSPDGFVWTTRMTQAVPGTVTQSMRVGIGCWYQSPGDVVSPMLADNLNVDLTAGDVATVTGDDGYPYLAVDVQPDNITGAFRVGTSLVGGPDRLAWSTDEPSTWVNIVCDVRSVELQRGAQRSAGVLTKADSGAVRVVLEDTAGQFDPNLSGDAIRKGTPARLRAWGTDGTGTRWDAVLFTGQLDGQEAEYLPDEVAPLVTLDLVDLITPLSTWESEGEAGDGAGAGDNLLQRALRILDTVGRGEVSAASSDTYTATLAPTRLARAWDELQEAATAELGELWVDRHNRVQVRSRGTQAVGPVRGTLSDVHGEAPLGVHACMSAASIVRTGAGMVNRVMGRRRQLDADLTEPPTVRRDDEESQARYGTESVTEMDLLLQSDAAVVAWAGALITERTRPELRVDSVSPAPPPGDLAAALEQWPAVLGTDLGDRWLFRYRPATGPVIARGLAVLGIRVTITPEEWAVQWTTETAPVPGAENPMGWFVVGLSQVGGGDVLAPYSVPFASS